MPRHSAKSSKPHQRKRKWLPHYVFAVCRNTYESFATREKKTREWNTNKQQKDKKQQKQLARITTTQKKHEKERKVTYSPLPCTFLYSRHLFNSKTVDKLLREGERLQKYRERESSCTKKTTWAKAFLRYTLSVLNNELTLKKRQRQQQHLQQMFWYGNDIRFLSFLPLYERQNQTKNKITV